MTKQHPPFSLNPEAPVWNPNSQPLPKINVTFLNGDVEEFTVKTMIELYKKVRDVRGLAFGSFKLKPDKETQTSLPFALTDGDSYTCFIDTLKDKLTPLRLGQHVVILHFWKEGNKKCAEWRSAIVKAVHNATVEFHYIGCTKNHITFFNLEKRKTWRNRITLEENLRHDQRLHLQRYDPVTGNVTRVSSMKVNGEINDFFTMDYIV